MEKRKGFRVEKVIWYASLFILLKKKCKETKKEKRIKKEIRYERYLFFSKLLKKACNYYRQLPLTFPSLEQLINKLKEKEKQKKEKITVYTSYEEVYYEYKLLCAYEQVLGIDKEKVILDELEQMNEIMLKEDLDFLIMLIKKDKEIRKIYEELKKNEQKYKQIKNILKEVEL